MKGWRSFADAAAKKTDQDQVVQLPGIGSQAQPSGVKTSTKPVGASAAQPITLERYLDLIQLMTRGTTVKPLTDLEAGALKMNDLKQVLAINNISGGKQNKAEALQSLMGKDLIIPPACSLSPSSSPTIDQNNIPPSSPIDTIEALKTLDWCRTLDFAAIDTAQLSSSGFFANFHVPDAQVYRELLQPDRMTLVETKPDQREISKSPSPINPSDDIQPSLPEIPEGWMAEGLALIAEDSQASHDHTASDTPPQAFLSRKVAFVLLEDFQQSGVNGIVDVISRGLHAGQIVEYIGPDHIDGTCEVDCQATHNFFFVRLPVSRSDAPEHTWYRRQMDLIVDLVPSNRLLALDEFCSLHTNNEKLVDAWALLEPKDEENDITDEYLDSIKQPMKIEKYKKEQMYKKHRST